MSFILKNKKQLFPSILLAVAVLLILSSIFGFLYRFDNKYTAPPPYGSEGIFKFEEADLSRPLALIDGWELYPDKLYTPEDFAVKAPPLGKTTFIGQYSNFSFFNEKQSPFGSVTYRLKLSYSGSSRSLVLFVPEIFTEYKLYAEGEVISSTGKNGIAAFGVDNSTELVLSVSNYSHYYSGLTYPPLIGDADIIGHMLLIKNIFYGLLFLFPLSLCMFAVASLFAKGYNRRFAHFGLLCLFFALQTSYHFFHGMGISGELLYALEDTSRMLVLYETVALCTLECDLYSKIWYRRFVKPLAVGFSILTAVTVVFIIPNASPIVNIYGKIIDGYRLLCVAYLCGCAVYGIIHEHSGSPFILAVCASAGASLYLNISQNSRFEPIYTGWQTEYSTLFMIIIFWVLIMRHIRELINTNNRLMGDLSAMVHQRTDELRAVLEERKIFFSNLAHDMKAPIASIHGFVNLILRGNIHVDKNLKEYLTLIGNETDELGQRVNMLSELHSFDKITEPPERIEINELLAQILKNNEPETCVAGILFEVEKLDAPAYIIGVRKKLLILFENLIMNAMSFTPEDGTISITAAVENNIAVIKLADSGCGIAAEHLSHIFDRFYSIRENRSEGTGLGLYIAKLTVDELGGTIEVSSELNEGTTFVIKLPLC